MNLQTLRALNPRNLRLLSVAFMECLNRNPLPHPLNLKHKHGIVETLRLLSLTFMESFIVTQKPLNPQP